MKRLIFGWLPAIPLVFLSFKKSDSDPKTPFTGMNTITWVGFGNQPVSSSIPVGATNLTAPNPFTYPKRVDNQGAFYQEVVKVDPQFKPGNPVTKPPLQGNWFVRRQVLQVKDGKTVVLTTTKIAISKTAETTNTPDLPLPFVATHIEYQLGRTEKAIGKPVGPNKPPKMTTFEVYPHEAVRVAMPVSWITANTCQVKEAVKKPIPCEFQMVKFQILGKSGTVLYETSSVEKGAVIQLPPADCKKKEGPYLVYDARWVVKRIHKPNFPVNKGYLIGWGQSGSDFNAEVDAHGPLVTGLQLDETLGKEFTLSFEVKKPAPDSGVATQMGELILENDGTITKFPPTQMPGATRAEAYIRLKWIAF